MSHPPKNNVRASWRAPNVPIAESTSAPNNPLASYRLLSFAIPLCEFHAPAANRFVEYAMAQRRHSIGASLCAGMTRVRSRRAYAHMPAHNYAYMPARTYARMSGPGMYRTRGRTVLPPLIGGGCRRPCGRGGGRKPDYSRFEADLGVGGGRPGSIASDGNRMVGGLVATPRASASTRKSAPSMCWP
jgi:hypothetical protein